MSGIEPSERIKKLPPYLFVRLEELKEKALKEGKDLIDLGIGDPDLPTPDFIVQAMKQALENPENHRYPTSRGLFAFRESASKYLERRFGVKISPEQIVTLIGSKEGIAHFPLGWLNQGDIALVPSPAYPVYKIGTIFAGGEPYFLPLKEENNFLPDLDSVPREVWERAKILFLNYPNNPTSAVCELEFFERAVFYARKYQLWVVNDLAYAELCFDGYLAPSILQVPGAEEVAIEFHSLSKTFNMTGWRIGFAVGAKPAVDILAKVKSNIDSGVFQAIQWAGVEALERGEPAIEEIRALYQRRRNILAEGLEQAGFKFQKPKATFYFWVKTPKGISSEEMVAILLEQAGIIASPGSGYGPEGEGYIRLAIVSDESRLGEAKKRLAGLKL